jgi:hypothetical protein
MVFGVIIAFVGIAGRTYVGFAVVGQRPPVLSRPASEPRVPQGLSSGIDLAVGNLSSLEDFTNTHSATSAFEQLLQGRLGTLIFAGFGCRPCSDLTRHRNRVVGRRLRRNAQVIVRAGQDDPEISREYRQLLQDKQLIFTDTNLFRETYRMAVRPTVITTDRFGFIASIRVGFGDTIDRGIIKLITGS